MEISLELEIELKREIFKASYYEFFKWAFKILMPSEEYVDAPHVKYLCDILQKELERILRREEKTQDIIVNIPPRTSKSLITSVAFLPWVWVHMPEATFICVSFDSKLSNKNSQDCRDIIKSPQYQELFGDLYQIRSDSDGKEEFTNTRQGARISTSSGSNITGRKGLFIIGDDLQNPKTAESQVQRKTTIDYWTGQLFNRLTPIQLGVRLLIMQRLHSEDLSEYLLDSDPENYFHICLPAELSDNITPPELRAFYSDEGLLDPHRLGSRVLAQFRKTLGERGYAGQYLQRPAPLGGGIIKQEWFDVLDPQTLSRNPQNEPIHFFIDSAYTVKQENDPTAILVCYKQNNQLYILDVQQKWLGFPELCAFIQQYVSRFQYSSYSKIFIEPKASGISIVQQLRSSTMLNVMESPAPKDDKVTRAHSITPMLESRRVKLVSGSYITEFVDQLVIFPNAVHDDMVDVLTMAVKELLENNSVDYFFV